MKAGDISLAKMRNVIKLMREHSVASFMLGDLSVTFAVKPNIQQVAATKPGKSAEDKQREHDRILYYSANGG